jgi:hypothetical protein
MKKAVLISPSKAAAAPVKAFMESVAKAGYSVSTVTELTDVAMMTHLFREAEFAVSYGVRSNTGPGRYYCTMAGTPYIVGDLGYLKRSKGSWDSSGYFQYGWNRIGWVPEGPCPSDRFDRLEIEVLRKKVRKGEGILIAGQVGGDGQHNMTSKQMSKWLCEFTRRKVQFLPYYKLTYRPHPVTPTTVLGKVRGGKAVIHQNPALVSAIDALDAAEMLVTYNSTLGVEAMIRAVPVLCAPQAHYHAVAAAGYEERLAYLHRLAYAQWTIDEVTRGEALDFLLQNKPNGKRVDDVRG